MPGPIHAGRLARRAIVMTATAALLYVLAPSLIAVLGTWPEVSRLRPWWLGAMAVTQSASIWSLWRLQAIVIGTEDRWAIGTSQLAGGALGRIIPGGAATASAAQYGMFAAATDDEMRRSSVASGLAMATVMQVAGLCALPLLALPAILFGSVPETFAQAALLGLGIFLGMSVLAILANRNDTLLRGIGTLVERIGRRLPRWDTPEHLGDRLIAIRDDTVDRLGDRLPAALLATMGRWLVDFLTLVFAVIAVGGSLSVWLLLLAFFTAQLLNQITITPGGIGVVEAGLTGALAAAGLAAGPAAIATLAYRLFNYGLMLPAGLVAWVIHRRRLTLAGRVEFDPDELLGPRN